ncbi:MAG: YceI family protein [Micavibrio sp.]|nr:YceI family protein [Micavibrio sp.]
MRKLALITALAATTLFATPANAEIQHFTLDKPHTQIMFFVEHMGVSLSHGEFYDYEGEITFDTENPENSSAQATIKTASIAMGSDGWDAHLKNKDFFNVEEFPEMTFKSTSIEKTAEKTAKINGDLTILDVTKPVTLDVTYNGSGEHAMNKKPIIGFSATTHIKRSDFGMNYGIPMVGDEVEIRLEIEGHGEK